VANTAVLWFGVLLVVVVLVAEIRQKEAA
jgi:hypothetical protein